MGSDAITPALALLARAEAAGLSLAAEEDTLRLRGPRPYDALLAELTAHKPAILAELRVRAERRMGEALAEAPKATGGGDQKADHRSRVGTGDRTGSARPDLARSVSWADPADVPSPGAWCRCCGRRRWWCEREAPKGWRCATCHPVTHLPPDARREVVT